MGRCPRESRPGLVLIQGLTAVCHGAIFRCAVGIINNGAVNDPRQVPQTDGWSCGMRRAKKREKVIEFNPPVPPFLLIVVTYSFKDPKISFHTTCIDMKEGDLLLWLKLHEKLFLVCRKIRKKEEKPGCPDLNLTINVVNRI